MKFTTTKNVKWDRYVGYHPKPWIETNKSHLQTIESYFENYIRVWDFDVCGNSTCDFLFDDGKAYRLEYSWWAEWHHEDEDENGLKDEYDIQEIMPEMADVPEYKLGGRDWL